MLPPSYLLPTSIDFLHALHTTKKNLKSRTFLRILHFALLPAAALSTTCVLSDSAAAAGAYRMPAYTSSLYFYAVREIEIEIGNGIPTESLH